jgi:hypothetical protein
MRKMLLALACLGSMAAALPVAAQSLAPGVAETMQYMREEEKLAHDVYLHFSGIYGGLAPGSKIFYHITESEQRHTEAVLGLLNLFGVEDPAVGLGPGEFADDSLQELYYTLVNVGGTDYEAALGVGVLIERKDITDILEAITLSAAYPEIVKVYSNLLTGSEHHLEAFLKVLDNEDSAASCNGAGNGRGKCGTGR